MAFARLALVALVFPCLVAAACAGAGARGTATADRRAAAATDPRFAGVQARGATVMGVDQFTATHLFTPTPDGGLIELQRDTTDDADIAQVRQHMREIAAAFTRGDFSMPGMVHAMTVPGTPVMAARRDRITYLAEDLPRGAQVRIRTTDRTALAAIHEFLAFQRQDHHAGMRHP